MLLLIGVSVLQTLITIATWEGCRAAGRYFRRPAQPPKCQSETFVAALAEFSDTVPPPP